MRWLWLALILPGCYGPPMDLSCHPVLNPDCLDANGDEDRDGIQNAVDACPHDPNTELECGEGCKPCPGQSDVCTATGTCVDTDPLKTWVHIPGGTFMMGKGAASFVMEHSVSVPSFEMTRTEITTLQYQTCLESGVCTEPVGPALIYMGAYQDHPVEGVSWDQAKAFCGWAGGRMPSEAEWEYAARSGGQDITYPWGEDQPDCLRAVMDDGTGPGCGQAHPWSWPVCSRPAGNTDQGLCDMAGNAREWLQDSWHDDYFEAPTDGSAWEDTQATDRVIRGGSRTSLSFDYSLRAWHRWYLPVDDQWTGFRCAR